jgi:asparagine synthase (glutamine-hydrolysing)
MCGIAGIVGSVGDGEIELVRRMTAALAHRGPDDHGLWTDDGVALGHRRLSILDLSPAGHQPMSDPSGRYWLTYNGELYNYLELRAELEGKGHSFRSSSDSEVLLAAWTEWGEAALDRFNGMWAFAIWDRTTRTLVAARDRFGKKPFYFAENAGRLYFASELKALCLVPSVDASPNPRALVAFFAERLSDHTSETFFQGATQLLPGELLVWRAGRHTKRKWWNLLDTSKSEVAATAEEIRALLSDAVSLRLRADTPVGCLVSGGLDSSAIACLMREDLKASSTVHVFTTLTGKPNEEADGVTKVLERGGFEPHFHTPNARSFWADLPRVFWHQEEPFADGSMAAHFALMREARAAGIPVLLSGQGADEVFAGYLTYLWVYLAELARRGELARVLRGVRVTSKHHRLTVRDVLLRSSFHLLPRAARTRVRRTLARRELGWLTPEALQYFKPRELGSLGGDGLNGYLRSSIGSLTLPAFLHYEDRNAMAFGVETRLPFLDYRLVERVLATPADTKLGSFSTKQLLRAAVAPFVPASIVERKAKQGYPAPLGQWLRELAPEIREVAHSVREGDVPLMNVRVWTRMVDEFLAGQDRLLDPVWRGLSVVLWREHVQKPLS